MSCQFLLKTLDLADEFGKTAGTGSEGVIRTGYGKPEGLLESSGATLFS